MTFQAKQHISFIKLMEGDGVLQKHNVIVCLYILTLCEIVLQSQEIIREPLLLWAVYSREMSQESLELDSSSSPEPTGQFSLLFKKKEKDPTVK